MEPKCDYCHEYLGSSGRGHKPSCSTLMWQRMPIGQQPMTEPSDKLPPSIASMLRQWHEDGFATYDIYTQAVAAEACRLQREADDKSRALPTATPLVVEPPEMTEPSDKVDADLVQRLRDPAGSRWWDEVEMALVMEAADLIERQQGEIAELTKANAQLFAHGEAMFKDRAKYAKAIREFIAAWNGAAETLRAALPVEPAL